MPTEFHQFEHEGWERTNTKAQFPGMPKDLDTPSPARPTLSQHGSDRKQEQRAGAEGRNQ